MTALKTIKFNRNGFSGELLTDYNSVKIIDFMSTLDSVVDADDAIVLQDGRNRNVRFQGVIGDVKCDFVIKRFGLGSSFNHRHGMSGGAAKAQKSWENACHLIKNGVGTPLPVAIVEKNDGLRVIESYFITNYVVETYTMTEELGRLFEKDPLCKKFMNLLQIVADNIKLMHDSGIQHRDLGNQNILLQRKGTDDWQNFNIIDLNRAKIFPQLSMKQRAKDLSRVWLPSDFLRVFFEMYFGHSIPKEFKKAESVYRKCYQWHHKSRKFRHPFRERLIVNDPNYKPEYLDNLDLWVWDDRSQQAQNVWLSKDKNKLYPPFRNLSIVVSVLRWFILLYKQFRKLRLDAFTIQVKPESLIGMSISPLESTWDKEYACLKDLGYKVSLLMRAYYHETENHHQFLIKIIKELGSEGYPIMIAFCQNRFAVKHPESWSLFIERILKETDGYVQRVEIGHTINRVKWGIWNYKEYAKMLEVLMPVKEKFSDIEWCGPAVIDFDYSDLLNVLDCVPRQWQFDAMSHQLYVDRRGAPENKQMGQATLDKIVWAKSIAKVHYATKNRLIISEVNWPIVGTGVYSPVGSPYLIPGVKYNNPSVSEELYAIYMIRYYLIACCSGFVDAVYWWQLVAHGFGMIDDRNENVWRRRKAFFAFKQLLKAMQGVRFKQMISPENSEDNGGVFIFSGAGFQLAVGYSTLNNGASINIKKSATVVDICGLTLDNNTNIIKLTESPIYITSAI